MRYQVTAWTQTALACVLLLGGLLHPFLLSLMLNATRARSFTPQHSTVQYTTGQYRAVHYRTSVGWQGNNLSLGSLGLIGFCCCTSLCPPCSPSACSRQGPCLLTPSNSSTLNLACLSRYHARCCSSLCELCSHWPCSRQGPCLLGPLSCQLRKLTQLLRITVSTVQCTPLCVSRGQAKTTSTRVREHIEQHDYDATSPGGRHPMCHVSAASCCTPLCSVCILGVLCRPLVLLRSLAC
jgi:hypothetical protein